VLSQLPSIDEAHEDESLRGYALRMAQRNGLKGLAGVATILGCRSMTEWGSPHIAALARLFGAEPGRLQTIAVRRGVRQGERSFQLMGQEISRSWLLRLERPQLCPACLRAFGYVRADWELQFVACCRLHGSRLIDTCPTCRKALSWRRTTLSHCDCGSRFSSLEPDPAAAPASLALTKWVSVRLGLPTSGAFGSDNGASVSPWAPLRALSLDAALRIVWALGVRRDSDDHVATGRTHGPIGIRTTEEIIERAASRLDAAVRCASGASVGAEIPMHGASVIAVARDGRTAHDREFAGHLLRVLGERTWQSARMKDMHPWSQMELL